MKLNYMLGLGIVLSLVGVSLLLAFGFLYLKPYLNVENFIETQCKTSYLKLQSNFLAKCECAADGSSPCYSSYPCVLTRVNFTDTIGDESIVNVTLYDSFETYFLQHNTLQCSYHKCSRVITDNIAAAKDFYERQDINNSYSCYYDPSDPNFALRDVITLSMVVNGMLWPSIAFVIGVIIFFVQVFHVGSTTSTTQSSHLSSLERQWARISERSYGRMTSAGSERLVLADGLDNARHMQH